VARISGFSFIEFLINTTNGNTKDSNMSTRKSILMMTNTGTDFNKVGIPIRADSWYGLTDGIHTVQVVYHNLTGGFGIQGTLSLEPAEEDWFWIQLVDSRGNCSQYPFIAYPKDPLHPTQSPGGTLNQLGDTGTEAFTFQGNFTFLRAILTRDYIRPVPMPQPDGRYYLGQIDRVLLSL
jgi:hypothetical protein